MDFSSSSERIMSTIKEKSCFFHVFPLMNVFKLTLNFLFEFSVMYYILLKIQVSLLLLPFHTLIFQIPF